ncbi:helix-turn-helix transcriptional regulator [Anaerocaecibacter muris]|uniref:helix-turn-helix transcriptional regulator n=1 Tax=Anaerocaecibacter muris TaxID=2941513 RepID=UPI003F69302E
MKLKIKELREECRMTQKELAQRIENVQRNVSNWENGTSEPDCDTILRLAEIFDVSIDELFGREHYPASANGDAQETLILSKMIKRLTAEQRNAVKFLILAFLK